MTGDAFHVTAGTMQGARGPGDWNNNDTVEKLKRLGSTLLNADTRNAAQVSHSGAGGTPWLNYEFRKCAEGRRIIDEIDRTLITGYGLPVHPLVEQIETMHTNSAHLLTEIRQTGQYLNSPWRSCAASGRDRTRPKNVSYSGQNRRNLADPSRFRAIAGQFRRAAEFRHGLSTAVSRPKRPTVTG